MEKMIQRAKSTLPPEARGGGKTSGPKKPSPYAAENNAAKLVRKRSTTGGQGTPSGPVPVDAQELDSLIYSQVQEILGMPLMQRAAAARAASRGGGAPKPPAAGRGGRRPAWNDDWNGQAASGPLNHEERHVGSVGSRSGVSNATAYERSPSKLSAAPKPRPAPTNGAQPRTSPSTGAVASRIPVPARIQLPPSGITNTGGGLQRRTSGRAPGAAEDRVVLLPSPSPAAAAAASKGAPGARPASSRYGSGAGGTAAAAGEPGAAAGASGHLLEHSVVAAIEVLNPHAPAAREAASRIAQHQFMQQQSSQRGERLAAAAPSSGSGGGAMGISSSFRGSGDVAGTASAVGASSRLLSGSASVLGAVGGHDASLMQSASLTATAAATGASQGGSPGTGASAAGSSLRRPPLAPALPRASGRGVPVAAGAAQNYHASSDRPMDAAGGDDDEDAYADDDFEEYEGTDDEGAAGEAGAGTDEGEEGGGAADVDPDVALLRDSVNALNGLVQLKIQHELARSQQQQPAAAQPEQPGGSSARGTHGPQDRLAAAGASGPDVLASLALVGSEEPDGSGNAHGPGRGDPTNSSLGDGLRQSDLDYLARLGGGDPHDGGEVATSTDERPFVIEPGAPAGTAKAWGDRQPWATGKDGDSAATGLAKLRERQERERQQPQRRLSQQGLSGGEGGSRQAGAEQAGAPQSARGGAVDRADEEDSVLLGETLTPRHRSGAAAQMQAVSSALAALASSGQLSAEEAKDLRSQTDALYGSLVQLHHLMNGPRGAELYSSSPSSSNGGGGSGGAKGFTPPDISPSDSPSQTARRQPAAQAAAAASGASPSKLAQMKLEPLDAQSKAEEGAMQQLRKPADGGGAPGNGSHLQLTPKHQLIPEDVAWMAGLVHSLSRSLRVEKDDAELPGS